MASGSGTAPGTADSDTKQAKDWASIRRHQNLHHRPRRHHHRQKSSRRMRIQAAHQPRSCLRHRFHRHHHRQTHCQQRRSAQAQAPEPGQVWPCLPDSWRPCCIRRDLCWPARTACCRAPSAMPTRTALGQPRVCRTCCRERCWWPIQNSLLRCRDFQRLGRTHCPSSRPCCRKRRPCFRQGQRWTSCSY